MNHIFTLTSDYIELNKLLKIHGIGDSGAQAKHLISQGQVTVNGVVELRIRNKLKSGDVVIYQDETVTVA